MAPPVAAQAGVKRPPARLPLSPLGGNIQSSPTPTGSTLTDPLFGRLRDALASEYAVEARIGAGGMASVYRAVDLRLRRSVAIKVLNAELATAATVERFRREARILAQLEHPNIVRVHRADERDGLAWYAMDLMPEGSLEDRLHAGPLPTTAVLRMARELASALAAAHAVGIIHRDVKPANVFFSHGAAMLGDFGVARMADGDDTLTSTGSAVGTPAYMAPELTCGGAADQRSDIWGLGATLYEALTGTRWLLSGEGRAWAPVARALRPALRGALATDPARRWPNAAAFAAALREPTRRRWPWLALGGMLAAAASVAALIRYVDPPLPPRPARALSANQLSIVPFGSPGDLGYRLGRYTAQSLEWFPLISTAPFAKSAGIAAEAAGRREISGSMLRSRYYVTGQVLGSGDSARLRLEIRDSADQLKRLVEVPQAADEVAWGAAAADAIMRELWPAHLAAYRELSPRGSANPEAARRFAECDEAFQQDAWTLAAARCNEALRLDPTLPQALWTLSLVHRWMRIPTDDDLRRLAGVLSELPEPYRRLVRAQGIRALGPRLDSLRAVALDHPTNETATFVEYDELFHRGPLLGVPLDSTLAEMQIRSDRDSLVWRALTDQLVWGYIRLGDEAGARKALQRRLLIAAATGQKSESASLARFLRIAFWGRFEPMRAQLALRLLLATADDSTMRRLARVFRVGGVPFDVPELQRLVGAELAVSGSTISARASGNIGEAVALLALARPAAATARYDRGVAVLESPAAGIASCEWRFALAAIGMFRPPPSELTGCRRLLHERLSDADGSTRTVVSLALDAASRGDTATLISLQQRLSSPADGMRRRVAALVNAELAAARGRFDQALELTAGLGTDDSLPAAGGPFARAVVFLHRGEWLVLAGRPADAGREWVWHQNSDSHGWPEGRLQAVEVDAMLGGLARLRRAEVRGAVADSTRCREAPRVASLWRQAEPGAAGLLSRARREAQGCPA